jgi:hypothetical protein
VHGGRVAEKLRIADYSRLGYGRHVVRECAQNAPWALSPLDVEDALAVHQAEVRAFTELPPSLRVMPLDRKPGRGWAGALTARDDEVTARADPLGAVSVRPQVSLRALRALLVRGMATAHAPTVARHLPPSAVTRHRRPSEWREPAAGGPAAA